MSTIAKAMELLDFFSLDRPEIGLSSIVARAMGRTQSPAWADESPRVSCR